MADGSAAERQAEYFLTRQGLTLISRNYRCRMGEIDLIMRERDTLVFIEVRQRRHAAFGGALASIDQRKQHKLMICAEVYLSRLSRLPACRFDVVLLQGDQATPHWIKNAFP